MDKKIEETREFLQTIGMPKAQQADICCYVILAMAGIEPDMLWSEATNEWIRIHDIIQFVNTFYGMSYAENSRETFRKQALHRFRTAALIEDNGKATNSPNYRYRLTEEIVKILRTMETPAWKESIKRFLCYHEKLIDLYASKKKMTMMPVNINGENFKFSVGKHNELQKAIIEEFAPRFAPNSECLYVGDTIEKDLVKNIEKLKELGFENVYVVKEQELPDGNFPTVSYPNPESPKAFELALKLAKEVDADIVLATDPDADRLGVYAKDTKTGEYVSFTGNMSGMLIAEYILREKKANGTLPANGALVETIVTTDMAKAIAKAYGVKLIEVLTGFKYIGEQIKFFEQQNSYEYVFGLEESYGCLAGTYARDKDACVAVMMLCEVAAWCKSNGITLWDDMLSLYGKYGYYKEGLETMTLKGMDGAEKIQSMMNEMRNNPPKKIGAWDVLALRDYKKDTRTDMTGGEVTPTGLPESNVLYYELSNHAWCCVRPSGTEPKIKFYFGVVGTDIKDSEKKLDELRNAMLTYAGE